MSLLGRVALRPSSVLARRQGPPSSRRNFSVVGALAAASESTAEGIAFIHHCGLPWYVAIPLVAAGVNFTCRLPVYWYVRVVQNRRKKILPLYQAWTATHANSRASLRPAKDSRAAKRSEAETFKLIRKSRQHLYREFNCQAYKSFTAVLSMGPFIVVSDALRRLVGFSSFSGDRSVGNAAELVDPSVVEGGLAWFTDLTAQDPYLILPVACSAVMATYTWRGMGIKKLIERLTRSSKRPNSIQFFGDVFGRVAILVPFIPLLLYSQPAAIFLYWITTFSLNHVNNAIYDRFLPPPAVELHPPPTDLPVVTPWIHSGATGNVGSSGDEHRKSPT